MFLRTGMVFLALFLCQSVFATLDGDSVIPLSIACGKADNINSFRSINQSLCAEADIREDLTVPMVLACLNLELQSIEEICPAKLFEVVDFPETPYTSDNAPTWDRSMKPLLHSIMGSSLAASESSKGKHKIDAAFFGIEFDQEVIQLFCLDDTTTFAKTDRIICGPYLPELALDDSSLPEVDITIAEKFESEDLVNSMSSMQKWSTMRDRYDSEFNRWKEVLGSHGVLFYNSRVEVVAASVSLKTGSENTSIQRLSMNNQWNSIFIRFQNYIRQQGYPNQVTSQQPDQTTGDGGMITIKVKLRYREPGK